MEKITKKELLILVSLTLLGIFLRVYKLDLYPAGFHGDEAWTGIGAKRILENGYIGFWSPAALGQTILPMYWTAVFFAFLGESVSTARFSFVLFWIFSIPFFYLFCRGIFASKTAAAATFFFVVDNISLILSRRADYVAANISFFPAIFFLFMAYKTNKNYHFIVAGILTGLLSHSYAALWVTPVLIFLILGLLSIIKKGGENSPSLKNILLLAIFYFIVALPIFASAINNKNAFTARSRMISVLSEQGINHAKKSLSPSISRLGVVLLNFKNTLLMFNFRGSHGQWDNSFSDKPIFSPVLGFLFLTGLILGLYKYRRKPEKLIFLYLPFLFFLAGSIFTVDSPNIRRSQISINFAYIFCGLGATAVYNFISNIPRKNLALKKTFQFVIVSIIIFTGLSRTWTYFSKTATSEEVKYLFCHPLVKISDFVKTLPKDTYVYFYSNRWSYDYETLRFLLADYKGENRSSQFGQYSLGSNLGTANKVYSNFANTPPDKAGMKRSSEQTCPQEYPACSEAKGRVVYIFLPEYSTSMKEVEKLYPKGKKEIHKDTDGTLIFLSYFIK